MFWWLSIAHAESYFPIKGSTISGEVDAVFDFMFWVSIFFFILLMGGMAYFAVKYRRKSDHDKTPYITHNHLLEFIWSFIPLVLLLIVFAWGYKVYHKSKHVPENAIEIQVIGKQWLWEFVYPQSPLAKKTVNDLYVPAGVPVVLNMTSEDVLHSFFVPSFRVKQDVIPGYRSQLWFEVPEPGTYRIFCTEYCGVSHSQMIGFVHVLPLKEYEEWLKQDSSAGKTLADLGKDLYTSKGCVACHSTDGTTKVGPSFKGIYAREHVFTDGTKLAKTTDEYIRESILSPMTKIVAGFPPAMLVYQGQITEEEIGQVIEFLKTLK